jgi:hypothetical protein
VSSFVVSDGWGTAAVAGSTYNSPTSGVFMFGGGSYPWDLATCVSSYDPDTYPWAAPVTILEANLWGSDSAIREIKLGPPWTTGRRWRLSASFKLAEHGTSSAVCTFQSITAVGFTAPDFFVAGSVIPQTEYESGFFSLRVDEGHGGIVRADIGWSGDDTFRDESDSILHRYVFLGVAEGSAVDVWADIPFALDPDTEYVIQIDADEDAGTYEVHLYPAGGDEGSAVCSLTVTPAACRLPPTVLTMTVSQTGPSDWRVDVDEITMCGSSDPDPLPVFGEFEEPQIFLASGANIELSGAYIPGSVEVFLDGLRLDPSSFAESDPTNGLIDVLGEPPGCLSVRYQLTRLILDRRIPSSVPPET